MKKRFRLHRAELAAVLCSIIFPLFTASTAYADTVDVGLNFTLMSPQGDFGDIVDRTGYGVSFEGVYKPPAFPFGVGLELGFMNYGSEDRKEPLTATIPDLRVRVDNDNNIITWNILFRYQLEMPVIRPYLDGIAGIKYLYTKTSLSGDPNVSIISSNNYDDTAFCYGIGCGFMKPLYRFENFAKKQDKVGLFLDCKVRYMIGEKAEYLKEGSIHCSGGDVSYDVYRSKTDMLLFHIGVVLSF